MIPIKTKKCKGIGKAKGFPGCGTEQLKRRYGLGYSCGCFTKWLNTTKEGKELVKRTTLQSTKARREYEKFEAEEKENRSIRSLLVNVRTICHAYIKERDNGKACISCEAPYHSNFQAGHFYKAELFSTLKYHEHNIHGQCPQCNIYNEGNESQYRVNLPKRIGQENFDELNRLASLDKLTDHKWNREKLVEIRNYYKSKLAELKKHPH